MVVVLKKTALGLAMILGAAAILLYSDLDSRRVSARQGASGSRPLRVAFVQQTSIPALDDGLTGALAALKERGYVDGGRMILRQYNAQGDTGTANAIAKEVTSGDFDLISDPSAVGVGVSRENHAVHPPYMTGVGSLAPVGDLFQLAKQLLPSLN